MSARRTPWWEKYRPQLFSCIDLKASYLSGGRAELRGFGSETLIEVEDSIELLLLGYGALREIGGESLPTKRDWDALIFSVESDLVRRAPSFDIGEAVVKGDPRVEALQPFTYSKGSLDLMLLQEAVLRATAKQKPNSKVMKCVLSLAWLDEAVAQLLHHDALTGVEYALRAREMLEEARPRLTRKELKTEYARESAQIKLDRDPKQQLMRTAKLLWREHRSRFPSKAKLAQFIQDELPGLESEANLVRRFGDWEKEGTSQA